MYIEIKHFKTLTVWSVFFSRVARSRVFTTCEQYLIKYETSYVIMNFYFLLQHKESHTQFGSNWYTNAIFIMKWIYNMTLKRSGASWTNINVRCQCPPPFYILIPNSLLFQYVYLFSKKHLLYTIYYCYRVSYVICFNKWFYFC